MAKNLYYPPPTRGNTSNTARFPWEHTTDPSNPNDPPRDTGGGGGFDHNGDPRHLPEYGGGGPGPGWNGPGGAANDVGGGGGGGTPYDLFAGKGNRSQKKLALNTGYQNLLDILASNGQTDPARLNLQFQGIDRGTEANQQAATGRLAGAGLEGSGLGQALQAAIGQSGTAQKSQAQANENALAEQRRREDLQLLYQLIIGPKLTKRGQDKQLQAALASRSKNGFDFGGILSALAPLLKGLGSGGGGDTYNPPASDSTNYPGDSGPQYTPGQDGSY
jgi:hypothetical protein